MNVNIILDHDVKLDDTRYNIYLRHIKVGTVSLPASRTYIDLDFPAMRHNWFPASTFTFHVNQP